MNLWSLFVVAGVVSWLLTGFLRHHALAKNLIDIPNERSSHSVPTPRGGVAIALTFLTALYLFAWRMRSQWRTFCITRDWSFLKFVELRYRLDCQ